MRDLSRILSIVFLVTALSIGDALAQGRDYYLSPKGDDSAAGTRDHPWRSINKANTSLRPGDRAIFFPGEYAGMIRPLHSGTAGAPITYLSASRRKAVLIHDGADWLALLSDRQHINIEGFYFEGGGQEWLKAENAKYITVRDCEMRRGGGRYSVLQFLHASQIRLLDNLLCADRFEADMVHFINCSEALIEGNSFTRVGHDPIRIHRSHNICIRSNVFHCEYGRSYEMWTSARVLFEGNIVTNARDGAGSAESGSKNLVDKSIIRLNRIYSNHDVPMTTSSYIYSGATATGEFRSHLSASHNRVYHNILADNPSVAWRISGKSVNTHIFQNNIFYRNGWAGGDVQIINNDSDNQFHNNLFRGRTPGEKVIRDEPNYWTVSEANEGAFEINGFWSEFMDNIDGDPAFSDAENNDYRLTRGSDAIDAGRALAMAIGEGRGRQLPVTDGLPFYDGFGIEGEKGDFIAIGTGDNIARIERVEFNYYQPAILHLDREVTWNDQMPVSLPWTGLAPDIGAYEYGSTHPGRLIAIAQPALAIQGVPVKFNADLNGKKLRSITWDFGDGAVANEATTSHRFKEVGQYAVTVRAIFENGERAIDVMFIQVEEANKGTATLAIVDFEDETEEQWGYHFKFYRARQTSSARVPRDDGKGKAMHLFYNDKGQNRTAGEVAPGIWKIEKYPLLSFEYRIPKGVPVALSMSPYLAPDHPRGFTIGGTRNHKGGYEDLNLFTLKDDDQWHRITVDLRRIKETYPQLEYLRQLTFSPNWDNNEGQEFWFDSVKIAEDRH